MFAVPRGSRRGPDQAPWWDELATPAAGLTLAVAGQAEEQLAAQICRRKALTRRSICSTVL